MENNNEQVKTLIDYKDIFDEFFNSDDYIRIGNKLNRSERTIRNYISGMIPDSITGRAVSIEILNEALIIVEEKKTKLESI